MSRNELLCHTGRVRPHLATLVADFRSHGLQLAVVTHRGNRRFPSTYAQLAELSARCARAYGEYGLKPGDRVLLWGNNSVEWAAAFFGCVLRGIVAVPLDAAGSLDFAQKVIAEVQPGLLAGDLSLLRTLPAGLAIPVLGFSRFAASLPTPDYSPAPQLSRDTPLQIIFTSGTTADPKGIVHTHGNVLASLDPLEMEIGKHLHYGRLVHPLRILQTLTLSHVFGQFMGLWIPSLLVAEVHFEDRLQAPRLARLMQRERISVMAAVPRVLELLRVWAEGEFPGLGKEVEAAGSESIAKRWWRFRSLHRRLGFKFWAFVAGGAALPADLERFWTTAGFALIQGYGMTETTALVTLNHPFKTARGSIGSPLAGREVRIGDDGEILVRGPSIATQVWRDGGLHPRTQNPVDDQQDWLATGDLAARDDLGHLIFAGRKSEVIVTSAGLNIHPEDLEEALRSRPGLRAALIVTQKTPAGPAPAAVLIASNNSVDNEVLQRAVDDANRDLAPFQQIRSWLRWPQQEFPRTATGKILRRTVQAWAQAFLLPGDERLPGAALSDPLIETLRALGVGNREFLPTDRLVEDLHLDSLAMVQLQSAFETRFGMDLADSDGGAVKTFGDLRHLSEQPEAVGAPGDASVVASSSLQEVPDPSQRPGRPGIAVFPRWPGWGPVRLIRNVFLECVMRPLLWLSLGPRVSAPVGLARPMLLVANHRTALDVPLILYALASSDREHVAVAMSDALLTGWRQGKAQRHRFTAPLTPVAYWMVTALFNVFPLPRGVGLRRSFAHAGEWMDRNHHVLVFPEGRRSPDGGLQPFQPGIGLLAQESEAPVLPIFVEGIGGRQGRRWPRRSTVSVRVGKPLVLEHGEDPQAFAHRLEAAVAALERI